MNYMLTIGPMETLRDGTQISRAEYERIYGKLEALNEKCFVALCDLAEKCNNPNYLIPTIWPSCDCNSKMILKKYELIKEDETVPYHVRQIVRNSIQGTKFSMKLVSPLRPEKIKQLPVPLNQNPYIQRLKALQAKNNL
jgi:hypothetical protein